MTTSTARRALSGMLLVLAGLAAAALAAGERIAAAVEDRRVAALPPDEALRELYRQTRAEVAAAVAHVPDLLPRPPQPQPAHAAILRRLGRLRARVDRLRFADERGRAATAALGWALDLYADALREYARAPGSAGAEAHVSRAEELLWTAASVIRGLGLEFGL